MPISQSRLVAWRLTILAVLASIIPLAHQAAALPTEIHSLISFEAGKLPGVPGTFGDPDVLGPPNGQPPADDEALITEGSYDEDADRYPDTILQFFRIFDRELIWGWGTHFWKPSAGPTGGQLLLLNPPPPQNAYQRGHILYERAISLYPTDPERAYYLLGRVAHLLEDMATPAHTHLDPHVSDTLAEFLRWPDLAADSFEDYLQHTYVDVSGSTTAGDVPGRPAFETAFIPQDLTPVSPADLSDAGHPELGDLYKLFHSMAKRSARWDSNDVSGTGPAGTGNGSLRYTVLTPNHVRLWHISDADCSRIAADLMPRAVAYVAELYRIFWRDTHPEEPDASGNR